MAEPGGQPALLQRVLPDWAAPEMPVHAVFASARYLSPRVRAFIDLLTERWGQQAPWEAAAPVPR